MNHDQLTPLRLLRQHISQPAFDQPAAMVAWLGAVQSQDYYGAKWALGQRLPAATDASIGQAFDAGAFLRTHVLRPTWHFVAPADLRWMLALTGPRVHRLNAAGYRTMGLDPDALLRTNAALEKALAGGRFATRPELMADLQQAGLTSDDNLRFAHIMMYAELEGLVCSGPVRGKQFTYALLEERVPPAKRLERDEALAALALRYFTSHGPATLPDFAWWSGLTLGDCRAGLEMVKSKLAEAVIEGQRYWFAEGPTPVKPPAPVAYLLPNYDEYIVGYKDRSAIYDASHAAYLDARGNVLFNHTVVIDGRIAGIWKRTVRKKDILLEINWFRTLEEAERLAVEAAVSRYGRFMGVPVTVNPIL